MPKNRKKEKNPPVWVSQNFLTSCKTINRIINKTSINNHDHVIEIGPGKGHITRSLVKCCKHVSAVEIDGQLYKKLKDKFKAIDNIKLYHHNFLRWKLPASSDYKVFSNIPFCITTNIVRKLTECKNAPVESWLIMEKGAAKRFMGRPYESLRSLLLKPKFDMNIIYYFNQHDFHPKPGVDIVLFHIKKKTKPDIPLYQWKAYEHFIASAFKHGLRSLFTKNQLYRAFLIAGIENDATHSEILYVQWLCLFRCYRTYVLNRK